MTEIKLPELGEEVKAATIVEWHVSVGDHVKEEDEILEVVTDKATFTIDAPCDGVLAEIRFEKGQEAQIGAVLGVIKT